MRFLHTVASLNDVFMKSYKSPYPAPPVTWIVQDFDLDLSTMDPPNAEGYLNALLSDKGGLSSAASTQLKEHNSVLSYIRTMFQSQAPPRIFALPFPKRGDHRRDLPLRAFDELDAGVCVCVCVLLCSPDAAALVVQSCMWCFSYYTHYSSSVVCIPVSAVPAFVGLRNAQLFFVHVRGLLVCTRAQCPALAVRLRRVQGVDAASA